MQKMVIYKVAVKCKIDIKMQKNVYRLVLKINSMSPQ